MAYCIICGECGEKIILERYSKYVENCPVCGFRIPQDCDKYPEESPEAEAEQRRVRGKEDSNIFDVPEFREENAPDLEEKAGEETGQNTQSAHREYVLRAPDGYEIVIPDKGGMVGRLGLGAEYLADYCAVSRRHLRVKPYKSQVEMEDLSSFGTWVDGVKQEKNEVFYVGPGSRITLYDAEFTLSVKGV